MNYLQLVNGLILESGLGNPLATISGQEDDDAKAVRWIADAWLDIQTSRGSAWSFLRDAAGAPLDYQYLESDTDVPLLPREFHKVIVWKALADYARTEGNEKRSLWSDAIGEYRRLYTQMVNTLLPPIT